MNQADSERMAGALEAAGYVCTEEPSDAQVGAMEGWEPGRVGVGWPEGVVWRLAWMLMGVELGKGPLCATGAGWLGLPPATDH